MRFIVFLTLAVGIIQCQQIDIPRLRYPPAKEPDAKARAVKWGTIDQQVDNFDPENNSTYKMRYAENDQFLKSGGPIFVLLGGEGAITSDWLQSGFMYDLAYENNAFMFIPEHRYYGESIPVPGNNWDSFKYLSADQAMADIVNSIQYMKTTKPELENSKVVVFGCSYPGNLAVWLREKYPDVIHAASSSSAPVLAEVDYKEFLQVVADVLIDCQSTIQNGLDQIREYLKTYEGEAKVQADLCTYVNIDNEYSVQSFFWNFAAKLGGLIQYSNSDTPSQICDAIQNNNLTTDYDKFVNYMKSCGKSDSERSNRDDGDSWSYQQCTEFGYFMSSASPDQPFYDNIPVEFWFNYSKRLFGTDYNSNITYTGVANTNRKYGGIKPSTSRVVSVHGTWDPWHTLGMKPSNNLDLPVYLVTGTSHCTDIYSESFGDSPEMLAAKEAKRFFINYWLSLD